MKTITQCVSAQFAQWLEDEDCKRQEVVNWWYATCPQGHYLYDVVFLQNAENVTVTLYYKRLK